MQVLTKAFIYVKIFLANITATELHFLEEFRFVKNTLGQKILKISMYEAPFYCNGTNTDRVSVIILKIKGNLYERT